jgi:uncharacterized protein (DUF2267 family)
VISNRVDEGEIQDIMNLLPEDLKQLWEPDPEHTRC